MGDQAFKMTKIGVCAYFLMPYSCMMFLLESWYSSTLLELFLTFVICLLMLLLGISLLHRYKQALNTGTEEEGDVAFSAAKMAGGSAILVILIQLVVRQFSMSFMRPSLHAVFGMLLFLLICTPFMLVSIIGLRKGLKRKNVLAISGSIDFLICRILSFYLMFTGIYQLLLWSFNTFSLSGHFISPFDLFWNAMPLGSIAIALAVYFAPLQINQRIKGLGQWTYQWLSLQACIVSGWLMLITASFEFFDRLLPHLARMAEGLASGGGAYGFMSARPLIEFGPAVIALVIGISVISLGETKRRQATETKQ